MIDEARLALIEAVSNEGEAFTPALALEFIAEVRRLRAEIDGWAAFATARNEEIAGLRAENERLRHKYEVEVVVGSCERHRWRPLAAGLTEEFCRDCGIRRTP